MTNETLIDEAFLAAFFGIGNDVNAGGHPEQPNLQRLIADATTASARGARSPILLPRKVGDDWLLYACATDSNEDFRLAESLRAFIGPTWSNFDGLPASVRRADPVDSAFAGLAPGSFYRVHLDAQRLDSAWRAAQLLVDVWRSAPVRNWKTSTSVGRLLRELDLALAARDAVLSEEILQDIAESGRLQATNVVFLKIRRFRVFGEWRAILAMPDLEDVLALRLPVAVCDSVLTALQEVHFSAFAAAGDAVGAIAEGAQLQARFGSLSHDLRVPPTSEARDALMALVVADGGGRERVGPLLTGLEPDAWRVKLAAALADEEGAVPALEDARRALREGRPGEAWRLVLNVSDIVARLNLGIHCALELDDDEVTATVSAWLAGADEAIAAAALMPGWFGRAWTEHVAAKAITPEVAPTPPVDSWQKLLQLLLAGDAPLCERMVEDLSPSWEAVGRSDEEVNSLLSQFDPDEQNYAALVRITPRLLESISDERPAPRSAATCVTLLALSPELTTATVRALLEALRLSTTNSPSEYADLLATVEEVVDRSISTRSAVWYLDAVDRLLDEPAPDAAARAAFCQRVLLRVHVMARRLDIAQRALCILLSRDVGLDLEWQASDSSSESAVVDLVWPGITVFLYSLQESVLRRVKDSLHEAAPDATVHLSHETDGSARMRTQVQASDLLVVATRRATHAATGAIEQWRPSGSRLIYAAGAGSASMLSATWEALRTVSE